MAKTRKPPKNQLVPYPEREITLTAQVRAAAALTALGYGPAEVAREIDSTRQTVKNYRQNKYFRELVREMEDTLGDDLDLELRLTVRRAHHMVNEALDKAADLMEAANGDGQLYAVQLAALKEVFAHAGRIVQAQTRAKEDSGRGSVAAAVVHLQVQFPQQIPAPEVEGEVMAIEEGEVDG